jgi:SEC-C motif-containing protein
VESTIRARFSAVVKKEVPYLLSTFHPLFHSAHYPGTEPGGAGDKLREDMQKTVENWSYSNLRIRKVRRAPPASCCGGLVQVQDDEQPPQ